MSRDILFRIEMLQARLELLRAQPRDSTIQIGIEAILHELARLSRELPSEWSLERSSLTEDVPDDSPSWP